MAKELIAVCAVLALGACQSVPGSFCRVMTGEDGDPILQPTQADVEAVSPQLAVGLVTVLEVGEKTCGWEP